MLTDSVRIILSPIICHAGVAGVIYAFLFAVNYISTHTYTGEEYFKDSYGQREIMFIKVCRGEMTDSDQKLDVASDDSITPVDAKVFLRAPYA